MTQRITKKTKGITGNDSRNDRKLSMERQKMTQRMTGNDQSNDRK